MRVLLAEDTIELANVLTVVLTRNKYAVDAVYNGIDALESGLTGIYDIILLDIMMPGMDGLEVLRKLRNENITTPVLVMSARCDLEDRINGLDCGADDYLSKPFAITELLARTICVPCRRKSSVQRRLSGRHGSIIWYWNMWSIWYTMTHF